MVENSRTKWMKKRCAMNREMAHAKRAAGVGPVQRSIDAELQWREQMKIMPPDTRDFTARFFGDPIPGDPRRQSA